ncbi:uncharacterized protein LOC144344619 [Saccoglossus kowalevskii]
MGKIKLTIRTRHCAYSSRDVDIFVKLISGTGGTEVIKLEHSEGWHKSPLFRKWEKDPVHNFGKSMWGDDDGIQTFEVQVGEEFMISNIRKLEIGHDYSRFVDGWLIGDITLADDIGRELHFHGPNKYGHEDTLVLYADDKPKSEEIPLIHHFVMGPILGYRGTSDEDKYQLCCLVVTEDKSTVLQPLQYKVMSVEAPDEVLESAESAKVISPLAESEYYKLWRYDCEFSRHLDTDYICEYVLPDNRRFTCLIPSFKSYPRITFASCSGFENLEEERNDINSYIMWIHMIEEHMSKPFHLMLLAGDQVYCDPVYNEMKKNRKKSGTDEYDISGLREEGRAKYFELYVSRWRIPEQAYMLARVPSIINIGPAPALNPAQIAILAQPWH